LACNPGFQLVSRQRVGLPLNCLQLLPNSYNLCIVCVGGYQLNEGQCVRIVRPSTSIPNCLTADSNGICSQCLPSFYLSNNRCMAVPANCVQNAGSVCVQCARGYVVRNGGCSSGGFMVIANC